MSFELNMSLGGIYLTLQEPMVKYAFFFTANRYAKDFDNCNKIKPPLKLGHGRVIYSYTKQWTYLLIHAII